jgi:hypothetical protein
MGQGASSATPTSQVGNAWRNHTIKAAMLFLGDLASSLVLAYLLGVCGQSLDGLGRRYQSLLALGLALEGLTGEKVQPTAMGVHMERQKPRRRVISIALLSVRVPATWNMPLAPYNLEGCMYGMCRTILVEADCLGSWCYTPQPNR